MYCPACKSKSLYPTKLAYGLPCFSCRSCGGSLVEILSYRMWKEDHITTDATEKQAEIREATDSGQAMVCPQCSKVMSKYQVSGQTDNKIDLCASCGRFWLDGGEWALLEKINLTGDITRIFNEPWQKSIREQRLRKVIADKYKKILGDDDFTKLEAFSSWVKAHEKRDAILTFLNSLD